ncbi:MAG: RNA polymerase factor sigma-54 [Thiomicrospira sp.]|uniref:RNA polymerase factor sigma-54 n=1 Tax=Thiomicrospira sp. TaxID=935 RepID=UPI0019EDA273|nr:RNA polymerase factor sigma-54 [Thiomicrospira sp.]MBE0493349.1 RNA polymerase factor sigma-54 [Thiomicrospira sp.]
MAMMPGLQINIGQQLKLTPQLQQSIKILQYSALEVQQTIQATLETNFMLEIEDDLVDDLDNSDESRDKNALEDLEAGGQLAADQDLKALDISDDANHADEAYSADYSWDDLYSDRQTTPSSSQTSRSQDSDEYSAPENYTAEQVSLHSHLNWQADIYAWPSDSFATIASFLIDEINDEGYLHAPLESVLNSIHQHEPSLKISLKDLETVLEIIQQFEPSGVGARSVQECLLLQLKSLPKTPYLVTAKQLIEEHFDWLSYRDHKRIKKVYGLDDAQLDELLRSIQSLNPRPGREFSVTQADIVVPDLRLFRSRQGWVVELNAEAFPRLNVNATYIDLASKLTNSEQARKIKEQLVEARGLIKSVQSRGETLLRVGRYIVEKQHRFFEEGEQAMQPLVLREVAEVLELHESTISRATNQKYIQTPRGTFELKYFFSTGVSQYGSDDQSAIAIKAHIKELISQEEAKKPLSDNKLMELLEEKDISVARRTIAKYREALGIPSSSERKKLHRFR